MAQDGEETVVDDAAADAAEENEPEFVEDANAERSFADIKHDFFGDGEEESPELGDDEGEVAEEKQEEVEEVRGGDPARERLAKIGRGDPENPTAAELLAEGEEEAEGGEEKVEKQESVETPAAVEAKEFRTPEGLRYRLIGPDGKARDLLAELKGAALEVFHDGAMRRVPIEKLPVVINHALLFNQKQHVMAQQAEGLDQRELAIQAREAEVERFFSDPDYREKVEKDLEHLSTPEGRLELKDQELQTRRQHDDAVETQEAAGLVSSQIVTPALAAIAEQNPLVAPEMIESVYGAAMMEFAPGDLKLRRDARTGNFKPVNPRAWQRVAQLLQRDIPQRVAAEQKRLTDLGVKPSKDDVAARKTKAANEAGIVREELKANRQAQRTGQTPGLRPNRDRPRQHTNTIQQGRKWLSGDDD